MDCEQFSKSFLSRTAVLELVNIYFANVRESKARGRDGIIPIALEGEIFKTCELISRRMCNGSYEFTQYREKLVLKGAGKSPRVISIPSARDRIALKALANFLSDLFPELRQVLAQKKVSEVREALRNSDLKSYVRIDVKDFYPSIQHSQVLAALADRVSDPQILTIFGRAISTPTVADGERRRRLIDKGVPQGLSISNLISELAMQPIDEVICGVAGLSYFRYVDDILILCDDHRKGSVKKKMMELLADRDLELNVSKSTTGSVSDGFDFLGYRFGSECLSVRTSNIRRMEASLARLFTKYKYEKARIGIGRASRRCVFFVNLRITGCIKDNIARGWLQYFRQMDDESLISKFDWVLENHRTRFNLPSDAKLKTFTRAFWSIKHPNSGHVNYVPNFDIYTNHEKRDLLIQLDGVGAVSWTDEEVDTKFDRLIRKSIIDLEKDVGSIS